jgi:hypothetical protein
MKGTSTDIAILKNAFPLIGHPKTMGGVIDHFKLIFLGNSFNSFNIAGISKDMGS